MDSFYVYIIYSKSLDQFYKGFTTHLEKRLEEHREGNSRYTSRVNDWTIFYQAQYNNKTEALIEEKRLKKLNRRSILKLNPYFFL